MDSPGKHYVLTVAESVKQLQADHPARAGSGWNFDGFYVWVESNEPALIRALDDYFAGFRRLAASSLAEAEAEAGGELTRITAIEAEPPDFGADRTMTIGEYKPSVKGPKEAFFDVADGRVISKLRTGMWFLFGLHSHLAIGPCTQNANQVINFVNNRKIQWSLRRAALLGHASAVCVRGQDDELPRAIAIAGSSGMGKSTLALKLLDDRRLDFLSNDRVMIRPPGLDTGVVEIEGVPKHPRINPGTILHNPDLAGLLEPDERARLEALPADELWQLEDKYDAPIPACFPNQRFALRGRLVGVVLMSWKRGAGETVARRVDLRQHSELLETLIKKPGVFYLPGAGEAPTRDMLRYQQYLDGVDVLELAGGIDFEAGTQAALELIGLR